MEKPKKNGAIFSDCRDYRYALWRVWDETKPFIMFIGLNPSTANETSDDPTIRRVKGFAETWGFGGVCMMNLFAWVTPYPDELEICADPLGENDQWINLISPMCSEVVFAWGSFREAEERAKSISLKFPEAKALGINKNGSPKHPLYIKADTMPVKFR